jgi:hypothetical protein
MAEPKIFRHQSGLMQAVKSDLEGVLEATLAVVEKVKSDPPPKGSLHPVGPGFYALTSENKEHPGLIETVILPKKIT